MGPVTQDAFLGGALTITQPRDGFRAGTDAVLLAAGLPALQGQTVLDLGCGVGTAALALAHRTGALPTGVELQESYADLARQNAATNGLPMTILTADLTDLPPEITEQTYDHVMFNPPYFPPGAGLPATEEGREIANRETTPLDIWIDVALRRLAPGGWCAMIHRTPALPRALKCLEPRTGDMRILPITARAGHPAKRVLILARKAARGPCLMCPPFVMHRGPHHTKDAESFSPEADSVLRSGAGLAQFLHL